MDHLDNLSSPVKQSLEVVDCFALELKALVVASACLDFEELTTFFGRWIGGGLKPYEG